MRDDYTAMDELPVRSEVWYCRENGCMVYKAVRSGRICPQCNSGEVFSPVQTCAPPSINKCLRCHYTAETTEFML